MAGSVRASLGETMASQTDDGDIVDLTMEAQDTKRGRNLKLLSLTVVKSAGSAG